MVGIVRRDGRTLFWEGEPPGEPSVLSAQQELRPPGITQDDLERLTDGWRKRNTNPKRKRGKNYREIPRLRFGLVWAASSHVCNPIV